MCCIWRLPPPKPRCSIRLRMHHDIGVRIRDIRLAVDEDVGDGAKDPVVRVVQIVVEKR